MLTDSVAVTWTHLHGRIDGHAMLCEGAES
jgi:hypothetical protein